MKVIETIVKDGLSSIDTGFWIGAIDEDLEKALNLTDGRKAVCIIDIPDPCECAPLGYELATDDHKKRPKPNGAMFLSEGLWCPASGDWRENIVYIIPIEPPKPKTVRIYTERQLTPFISSPDVANEIPYADAERLGMV